MILTAENNGEYLTESGGFIINAEDITGNGKDFLGFQVELYNSRMFFNGVQANMSLSKASSTFGSDQEGEIIALFSKEAYDTTTSAFSLGDNNGSQFYNYVNSGFSGDPLGNLVRYSGSQDMKLEQFIFGFKI